MGSEAFRTAFLIAALCACVMGFAIQRGATCTVAAVDEWVRTKKSTRLVAMIEASIWVAGGLLFARQFQFQEHSFTGYNLTFATVLGAMLLGMGALVNRACVFGAVARIGNGEWAFVATPVGFYLGCQLVNYFALPAPVVLPSSESLVLNSANWLVWPFLLFLAWRSYGFLQDLKRGKPLWSPHVATLVIGVTFFLTWQLAGAWAYTELLADLASKMAKHTTARVFFATALLLGAILGGWTSGKLSHRMPSIKDSTRCLIGGFLMGCGGLLIPGGNDGLVLLGMPLLLPYAWVAFGTMCLTIATGLLVSSRRAT
jgi:hypothetical protein